MSISNRNPAKVERTTAPEPDGAKVTRDAAPSRTGPKKNPGQPGAETLGKADVYSVVLLVYVALATQGDAGLAVSLVRIAGAAFVYILVHELGHALAAWGLGLAISDVRIGKGPKLFEFRIGVIPYRFYAMPLSGAVRSFLSSRPWKNIMMYLAGPMLPVAVFAFLPFDALRQLSIWMLILNLLPIKPNDGYHVRRIWKARRAGVPTKAAAPV